MNSEEWLVLCVREVPNTFKEFEEEYFGIKSVYLNQIDV